MKRIVTSFGTFLTGDRLADAVCRYSLALAGNFDSAFVDIPYADAHGHRRRVQLRVGWLVDLGVVTAKSEGAEVEDEETVDRILRQSASVERRPGLGASSSSDLTYWESSI